MTASRRAQQFTARFRAALAELPGRVASRVAEQVILNTPVAEGRARANWQATVGAPATASTLEVDPAGTRTVEKATAVYDAAPAGSVLYLTNLVDYIGRLNEGSSNQAPANFVERAISDGAKQALSEPIL